MESILIVLFTLAAKHWIISLDIIGLIGVLFYYWNEQAETTKEAITTGLLTYACFGLGLVGLICSPIGFIKFLWYVV